MKIYQKALIVASIAMLVGGCKEDDAPVAATSKADVKKYVSIGNSLTAGYQSGGLYKSAQQNGYPNLIAKQLVSASATIGTFEIPYWDDPGSYGTDVTKASRLVLRSLTGPDIRTEGVAPGVASNFNLPRAYDNLVIPGSVIYDFLDESEFLAKSASRKNPFFAHVLRQASYGASVKKQAKALNPDLVTFWLGNNDVLGFATSGGTDTNKFDGKTTPTPAAMFTPMYNAALDSLRAALPNAKLVVANIPDVKAVPYFTTVGPKVGASLAAKGGISLYYQKHGEAGPGSGSSKLSGAAGDPYITLPGSTIATLFLGDTTGAYYSSTGVTPGAGIIINQPFGVHPYNPFPDKYVLDSAETATATASVLAFNTTIAAAATKNNAGLVDINTFFNGVKANGITVGGTKYTADFITGQLFSLDGVHPSSKGQGIIANEFIKVMNKKFGFTIAEVNITTLPGIDVTPLAKYIGDSKTIAGKSLDSWTPFLNLWK
ncbi:MAG: SGNH/GDSL hydrolase family protein [Bacteriovoracaceae bacterium]